MRRECDISLVRGAMVCCVGAMACCSGYTQRGWRALSDVFARPRRSIAAAAVVEAGCGSFAHAACVAGSIAILWPKRAAQMVAAASVPLEGVGRRSPPVNSCYTCRYTRYTCRYTCRYTYRQSIPEARREHSKSLLIKKRGPAGRVRARTLACWRHVVSNYSTPPVPERRTACTRSAPSVPAQPAVGAS